MKKNFTNINTALLVNLPKESTAMSSYRKIAIVVGILYLLTFISIPTIALYSSIHKPNYIIGLGPDRGVIIGAILEIFVGLACIGTGVVLYPILKKQNEGLALGFVGTRILEAGTIFMGVVFLLSVVNLRRSGVNTDAIIIGQALVTLYDMMFLIGQSFLPVVNALLLGSLLYRSGLVPPVLPVIGFLGAFLLLVKDIAVLFDLIGQYSPISGLATIPIALWEFSLGIYLIVKGFKPRLPKSS